MCLYFLQSAFFEEMATHFNTSLEYGAPRSREHCIIQSDSYNDRELLSGRGLGSDRLTALTGIQTGGVFCMQPSRYPYIHKPVTNCKGQLMPVADCGPDFEGGWNPAALSGSELLLLAGYPCMLWDFLLQSCLDTYLSLKSMG